MLHFITREDEILGSHFIRDLRMITNSKIIIRMLIDLDLIHLSISLLTQPFLILATVCLFCYEIYFKSCGS